MLFSITRKDNSAQDLAKHLGWDPKAVERVEMPFGAVSLFFPEFAADKAEAVCLLDVVETKLFSERPFQGQGHPIQQYVHAKAYISGSFMALAIGKIIDNLPPTEDQTAHNLEINLTALRSAVDAKTLQAWFRPLGWQLFLQEHLLDPAFPAWGNAHIYDLRLRGKASLPAALSQIQILLCALDGDHIFDLGIPETQAILALAQAAIPQHPYFQDIYNAIANFPDFRNRLQLAGLFEYQDEAGLSPAPTAPFALHSEAWSRPLIDAVSGNGHKSVLLFLTGEIGQLLDIVQIASVEKFCICHPVIAPLQQLAQKINASPLTEAEKRKFQLLVSAPIYKNQHLKNIDVVIVQGFQAAYPSCHQAPIAELIFGFLNAQQVIWLESAPKDFENWASGVAKIYPYAPQITHYAADGESYQVALFHKTETE